MYYYTHIFLIHIFAGENNVRISNNEKTLALSIRKLMETIPFAKILQAKMHLMDIFLKNPMTLLWELQMIFPLT